MHSLCAVLSGNEKCVVCEFVIFSFIILHVDIKINSILDVNIIHQQTGVINMPPYILGCNIIKQL